jgi:hypothetical protein
MKVKIKLTFDKVYNFSVRHMLHQGSIDLFEMHRMKDKIMLMYTNTEDLLTDDTKTSFLLSLNQSTSAKCILPKNTGQRIPMFTLGYKDTYDSSHQQWFMVFYTFHKNPSPESLFTYIFTSFKNIFKLSLFSPSF